MFSIKSILCVIVGFFVGVVVCSYWNSEDGSSRLDLSQKSSEKHDSKDDSVSSAELKLLIADVVRTELAAQLSMYYENDQLKNVADSADASNKDSDGVLKNNRVELAYESANQVLDGVTSSGGFDAYSAKEFIDHLNSLPHDKAMELRAKHMDAVNRGLISSPYPPEEFLQVEQ